MLSETFINMLLIYFVKMNIMDLLGTGVSRTVSPPYYLLKHLFLNKTICLPLFVDTKLDTLYCSHALVIQKLLDPTHRRLHLILFRQLCRRQLFTYRFQGNGGLEF